MKDRVGFAAALFVVITLAIVFMVVNAASSTTVVRTTRYRCDHTPGLNTEWAGDDDVLIRGPKGNFHCVQLDALLPRLLTGYYPDGHEVYGNLAVTDGDGGTGGEG